MNFSIDAYQVGPLLYCPANHKTIADSLIHNQFGGHFSLAFCLEDTIKDSCVLEAEQILLQSLKQIHTARQSSDFFLPQIFIRVRTPEQIYHLTHRMQESRDIVTGFIAPKFSLSTGDAYIDILLKTNADFHTAFFLMPILESSEMIFPTSRYQMLSSLKDKIDAVSDRILNVRVGGNDLCHAFGFRRHADESIYQLRPVAQLLTDIVTVFARDYIVSGPVWEYYNGPLWESGLLHELKEDRLCGFIGKTAIHPKQIPVINQAYQVSSNDYEDAKSILNWDESSSSFVSANASKERMNEYKTHTNWAMRTLLLAKTYGIRS